MMMEVKEELIIFLLAVVSGGIVRLSYRFLHCVRQIVRHNLLAIEIEDFLFWIFSAMFLFVQIYHTTSGSIRWHFVLGVVFGAVISSFALWKAEKVYKKIYTRNQKKSFRFLAKKNKKRYQKSVDKIWKHVISFGSCRLRQQPTEP